MVERTYGIVQFIVIKKSQYVVDLSTTRTVIECGFVHVDRTRKISVGRFAVCILHQLRVARSPDPIARTQTTDEQDRQPNAGDRDAIMLRHLANQRFSELTI